MIGHMGLRKAIGALGIAFPFALFIGSYFICGCSEIFDSISAYHHSSMRNLFVGVLCAIALFFFSYSGYDRADFISWKLAALFALGIAFFPTDPVISLELLENENIKAAFAECEYPSIYNNSIYGIIHLVFAAAFFLTLTYISYFLFTKSGDDNPDQQKLNRNRVFRGSAAVMLICLIAIAIYMLALRGDYPYLDSLKPVFWLESIALIAFGASWITKGQFILKDAEQ